MKHKYRGCIVVLFLFFSELASGQIIDLSGTWSFKLDSSNVGLHEQWFNARLPQKINMRGSCEERGYGVVSTENSPDRLTRAIRYEGKGWYQRSFVIPPNWKHKRLELFLERCHWISMVWIDGKPLGTRNSLSAPHQYEIIPLSPGEHTLTICIDNTYGEIPIGTWGFAITDDTQGNWNGMIGRLEIRATDPVWIEDVQLFPNHQVVKLGNMTGIPQDAFLQNQPISIPVGGTSVQLPSNPAKTTWDEFNPVLQSEELTFKTAVYQHTKRIQYGNRILSTRKGQFIVNDEVVGFDSWGVYRQSILQDSRRYC